VKAPFSPHAKPQQHTVGRGSCSPCGGNLAECPGCGQKTGHHIAGEFVCENKCNPRESISTTWRAEMKEALYQLELREARERAGAAR
jgi:hypothetical protein